MKSYDFLTEGIVEDAHEMHQDHEVQMARKDCYEAAEHAIALHKMLRHVSENQGIEGWVAAKITLASDYLNTVREYLEYELMSQHSDPMQSTEAPLSVEFPIAESQAVTEGKMKDLDLDLKKPPVGMTDQAFKKKYNMTKAEAKSKFSAKDKVAEGSKLTKKEYVKRIDQSKKDIEDMRKQGTFGPAGSLKDVKWVKKQGMAEDSDDYRVTWTEAGQKHTTGLLPKAQAQGSAKKLQNKPGTSNVKVVPYSNVNEQGVAESKYPWLDSPKKKEEQDKRKKEQQAKKKDKEQGISEMSAGSVATVVNPTPKNKAKVGSLFGGTYQREEADTVPKKRMFTKKA